ncbi:MAG TPA: hypothetical protein VHJ20_16520 [Polyangia bacterium]|nr:hypothetical protein [Polyangia bacterium]
MVRTLIRSKLAHVIVGVAFAGVFANACGDTVTAKDCHASCQDVDTTCVKACSDDACKTKCASDLDNCSASCSTVTVSPPDGGQ